MRQIKLTLLLLLFAHISFGQTEPNQTQKLGSARSVTEILGGLKADSGLVSPVRDTINHPYKAFSGSMTYWQDKIWVRSTLQNRWIAFGGIMNGSIGSLDQVLTAGNASTLGAILGALRVTPTGGLVIDDGSNTGIKLGGGDAYITVTNQSNGKQLQISLASLTANHILTAPDSNGVIATREWVLSQNFGSGSGGGVTNGSKVDVTVAGTTWTINPGVITGGKIVSSVALAGSPTTTTQTTADSSTRISTTAFVKKNIKPVYDSLAAIRLSIPSGLSDGYKQDISVVGDNWSINSGAVSSPKIASSISLSGNPTAATQLSSDSSTRISTTAFVKKAAKPLYDSITVLRNSIGAGISDGVKQDITVAGDTWTINNDAVTTTKIPASINIRGSPTIGVQPADNDSTSKIATTAFLLRNIKPIYHSSLKFRGLGTISSPVDLINVADSTAFKDSVAVLRALIGTPTTLQTRTVLGQGATGTARPIYTDNKTLQFNSDTLITTIAYSARAAGIYGTGDKTSQIQAVLSGGSKYILFNDPQGYNINGNLVVPADAVLAFENNAYLYSSAQTGTLTGGRVSCDPLQKVFDTSLLVRKVRAANGFWSVVNFGGVSDYLENNSNSSTATDNSTPFTRAVSANLDSTSNDPWYYFSTKVYIPKSPDGTFYKLKKTWNLDVGVELFGDGVYQARLLFSSVDTGIYVRSVNVAQGRKAGKNAFLHDFSIWGKTGDYGTGYDDSSSHGLLVCANNTHVLRLGAFNFNADGIHVWGSATDPTEPTNANNCKIENCISKYNSGFGLRFIGPDANQCTAAGNDLTANGRYGGGDFSFLGNLWSGNHAATDGLENVWAKTTVKYAGKYYQASTRNTNKRPDLYPAYWDYLTDSTFYLPWYPQWDSTIAYFDGGSYILQGANQLGVFQENYAEGGTRYGRNNGSNILINGFGGAFMEGGGRLYVVGGNLTTDDIQSFNPAINVHSILYGKTSSLIGFFDGDNNLRLGLKYYKGGKGMTFSLNNTDGNVGIYTDRTYGRDVAPSGATMGFDDGLWIRALGISANRNFKLTTNTTAPTSGDYAVGDYLKYVGSASSTTLGFVCTGASTGGTGATFRTETTGSGGGSSAGASGDVQIGDGSGGFSASSALNYASNGLTIKNTAPNLHIFDNTSGNNSDWSFGVAGSSYGYGEFGIRNNTVGFNALRINAAGKWKLETYSFSSGPSMIPMIKANGDLNAYTNLSFDENTNKLSLTGTLNLSTPATGSSSDKMAVWDATSHDIKIVDQPSGMELTTNKATDFSTVNNTKYPTTQAVANYVAAANPFIVVQRTTADATPDVAYTYTPSASEHFTLEVTCNAIAGAGGSYGAKKTRSFYWDGSTLSAGTLVVARGDEYIGTGLSTASFTIDVSSGSARVVFTGESASINEKYTILLTKETPSL